MPLTIEIEPQIEARLREQAAERGFSLEAEIARRPSLSTLTDEERGELKDELDIAAANRSREEDAANFSTRKTLDDLRRVRLQERKRHISADQSAG